MVRARGPKGILMKTPIVPFQTDIATCNILRGIIAGLNDLENPTSVISVADDEHIYMHRDNCGTIAIERDLCQFQNPKKLYRFISTLIANQKDDWQAVHLCYEDLVTTALGIALIDGSLDRSSHPRNFEVCGDGKKWKKIALWHENDAMTSELQEAMQLHGPIGIGYHTYTQTIIPEVVQRVSGKLYAIDVIAKSFTDQEGFLLELNDPDPLSLLELEARRQKI